MRNVAVIVLVLICNWTFSQQQHDKCFDRIRAKHYNVHTNNRLLYDFVSLDDTTFKFAGYYKLIVSPGEDKFIAFFVTDDIEVRSTESQLSQVVKGETPRFEGHLVMGMKYNGQWFYSTKLQTFLYDRSSDAAREYYFCKALLNLDYADCRTGEQKEEFWSKGWFETLQVKKNWRPAETEINRPYIGLPGIVAETKHQNFQIQKEYFDSIIYSRYILPHVDQLAADRVFEKVTAEQMSKKFVLIYPPDKRLVIYPLTFKTSGTDHHIRFFVLDRTTDNVRTYEWNYLQITHFKVFPDGSPVLELINTLTYWDYTIPYISNTEFWEEYVAKKSGNVYLYLSELNRK